MKKEAFRYYERHGGRFFLFPYYYSPPSAFDTRFGVGYQLHQPAVRGRTRDPSLPLPFHTLCTLDQGSQASQQACLHTTVTQPYSVLYQVAMLHF